LEHKEQEVNLLLVVTEDVCRKNAVNNNHQQFGDRKGIMPVETPFQ